MRSGFGSEAKRGMRAERGAVAVEFAIVVPIFLLLVFGIVDFGHAWYMKQIVSNASREGARYGTRYSVLPQTPSTPPSAVMYLTPPRKTATKEGWV